MILQEPTAREHKPEFSDLPPAIFRQLEKLCKSKIVTTEVAHGGISASARFIMTLASGEKIFVKGTHPAETSHGAANLAQEVAAYESVAVLRDVAPPYVGLVSDGEQDGWILGVWKFIENDPALANVERMISCIQVWQDAKVEHHTLIPAREHNYIKLFFTNEKKWLRPRHDPVVRQKFLGLFQYPSVANAWFDKNIASLCDYQARVNKMKGREVLLHGDLRPDNFLFSADRTRAVDWPNVCYGPQVFDLCFLLSSLEGLGQGKTDELLAKFDGIDWDEVIAMLASLSGYFADQAYRDVPAAMPRLRWVQQSMLLAQLKTLARLGIIESPPKMTGENQ